MPRAWVFGDDLDTDQMVPGRYAPFMVGQDKFQNYAFYDARPGFAKEVRPGDILVGGENFGCGSSREYAVAALKKLGVGGVVAKNFARIFFRNCINLGIPVVESADAVALRDAGGGEVLLRRDRIREMKRAEKSIMPEGLERAMSEQEFRDLLAFLQGLK